MNQLHIKQKKRRNTLFVIVALFLLMSLVGYYMVYKNKPESAVKSVHTEASKKTAGFNKSAHSIDTPGSLWWIVSKKRPLPEGYVPPDLVTPNVTLNSKKSAAENTLRSETSTALEGLFGAAKTAGFEFMLASGYRSSELQATYYNNYVATSGQAEADRYSAKPGTSEHQTGLSLDVARVDRKLYLDQTFGEDPSGKWLAEHTYEYGFIVRYPKDKESITGYMYEPWHIRFVGKDLANELHSKNQTMEEFFGL